MRKEEKTRLRREKIITAALFEFATKGYQGFVINELCKVDGISLADYMERRHQFYQQYPEHSHIFFEAMIATPEELEADIAPQKAIFLDLNEQVCQKLISESKSYLFGLE